MFLSRRLRSCVPFCYCCQASVGQHGICLKTTFNFAQNFCNKTFGDASKIPEFLERTLDCSRLDAHRIYMRNPVLRKHGTAKLTEQIIFLQQLGIFNDAIMNHPFLLVQPKHELKRKLDIFHSLQIKDVEIYLSLLEVHIQNISLMKHIWLHDICIYKKNRIIYLSEELNIEPKKVCERFSKTNPKLLRKPLDSMIDTLNILRRYNFDSETILRNLRAFDCSNESIVRRMEELKSYNMKLRLWTLYCSHIKLDRYVSNHIAEQEAIGEHKERFDFFKNKLDLENEEVALIFRRNPRLYKSKLRRVTKIIDYFLEETRYIQEDIVAEPNILNYSLETIKRRLAFAEQTDQTDISLKRLRAITKREMDKVLGNDRVLLDECESEDLNN